MLSRWKYRILLAGFWLAATGVVGARAQAPTPVPTPPVQNPYGAAPAPAAAPPAWNTQQPSTGYAPMPGEAPPIPPAGGGFGAPYGTLGGGEDDSYFAPATPAPGFDYFDEEDSGATGGGGGYGTEGARGPVKDSVKFVGTPPSHSCKSWGNTLLGPTTYSDQTTCEFELNQKVDKSTASIEDTYDQVELFKLKKVIHGDLASRAEANKYNVSFDSLKKALSDASKKGCTCQKK